MEKVVTNLKRQVKRRARRGR